MVARPLVEACYKAIVVRGGHPLVRLEIPGLNEFFIERATEAQLAHVPPTALFEAQSAAGRIRIAAESDTRSMSRVDPRRQALFERAREPIRQATRQARWVVTQYPTAAYASLAPHAFARLRRVRHASDVPGSVRPAGCLARAGAPASRDWSSS